MKFEKQITLEINICTLDSNDLRYSAVLGISKYIQAIPLTSNVPESNIYENTSPINSKSPSKLLSKLLSLYFDIKITDTVCLAVLKCINDLFHHNSNFDIKSQILDQFYESLNII